MKIEHWWFQLPLRLRSILFRGRVERELQEELQFHLDHKIEEGVASGLTRDEARLAALREMDGLEQRKEEMRDLRGVHWFTDFVDDLRFAVRSLRRASGLTGFVVITLAMGIGLTAASFSMVDSLIFRPYPVPNPSNVVSLVGTSRDNAFDQFSYREYLDLRDKTQCYEGVVANNAIGAVSFAAEPTATPRVKGGLLVSGNYFRVLGVEPRVGRSFRDDEDQVPGRDAVVVLGRDCWKTEFASDPSVVGRTIRLNGIDFTVIGVAPETFPGMFIFSRPDFFVPLAMAGKLTTDPSRNFFEDRDDRELLVKGRLKAGTTLAEARSELAVLAQDLEREYPATNRNRGAAVRTQFEMRTRGDDVNWKFGVIFTVLALAVLLVACTNVAGLILSRTSTRTREIAVRLALGAGHFRLIRLLLAESLILALLGGLAGVAVGYFAIDWLRTFSIPTSLPVTVPFQMDVRVLAVSLTLSMVSAILCGLAPALQSTRTDLVHGLKAADVEAPGRKRLWGRNVLVVAQVSTSLMLLTASFLMLRGFQHSMDERTEFTRLAKEHVLMASFDPRLVQYDAARTERFYQQLADRVRELPGVRHAGYTLNPPLGLDDFEALAFVPDGFPMPVDRETFTSMLDVVDEGYFETMGVPIARGRGFLASDTEESPRVAVVNQHFADHYWPGGDALGKRFRRGGPEGESIEIVGITPTLKYRDTTDPGSDFVYVPLAQNPRARMVMLLHSNGAPLELVEPLKQVVATLDPNMPMVETRTYDDIYRYSAVEGPGVAVKMVGTMSAIALLLSIAGLYGLIAFNVSRRTREIGIRMAIGAAPSQVLRMVMHKGIVLVGVGTVIGLVMGFMLEKAMNSMLFNAGGMDFAAYAVVVPAMFLATMLAAFVPALKASRIHPTEALRYE